MTAAPEERSKLFREEVLATKRATWLGQIVLIRPLSFTFLTAIAVVLAALALAFLFWGEYTRKAQASGYVVPAQGILKIAAPQDGVIIELRTREGQQVQQGEVLAVLNSERATATGGVQAGVEQQIAVRRASLLRERDEVGTVYAQQAQSLVERIASQRSELAQVESGYKLQQERIRIAEGMLEKQRQLRAGGLIAELTLEEKEQAHLSELAALGTLERSRTAMLRDISVLEAERQMLPAKRDGEIAALERQLAALEQDRIENESRREIRLTAPRTGIVTALAAQPGKRAVAGQPLLTLIPRGAGLQAVVYVPARAAGFVHAGAHVLLQYQAFPYQKFGSQQGTIVSVARVALADNELPFPAQQGEMFYLTTIELAKQSVTAYGKEEPLQAGMRVDCRILLERRTLFEWVFEPLYSISGRWGA